MAGSRRAAFAAATAGVFLSASPLQGSAAVPGRPRETAATLNRYCVTCHNPQLKTAGLVIDPARLDHMDTSAEMWEDILANSAPARCLPQVCPAPNLPYTSVFPNTSTGQLAANAAAHPNPGGVLPVHRLTRTEYKNSIRDLLALSDLPKEMDYTTLLPADNISSGFDNLADTLFVSPVSMERYLDAARKISRLAAGDPDIGLLVNVHQTSVRQTQEGREEQLPFGTRGGMALHSYFPLDGEYEFQVAVAGLQRDAHELELTIDGTRQAMVSLTGRRADDDDPSSPGNQKFRAAVKAGPRTVDVAFIERSEALSESFLRPPGRTRGALPSIVSVTITGPYNATGPGDTPSRRRIFTCRPRDAAEEPACAKQIVSTLMRRAYRRPVTDADLAPAMKFYASGRAERDFDRGIERALERMLVSPQFLFRIEEEPANVAAGAPYRVSDTELASRLSFFLWSSIPDDELLTAATRGKLPPARRSSRASRADAGRPPRRNAGHQFCGAVAIPARRREQRPGPLSLSRFRRRPEARL